jgi:hypothetical protein
MVIHNNLLFFFIIFIYMTIFFFFKLIEPYLGVKLRLFYWALITLIVLVIIAIIVHNYTVCRSYLYTLILTSFVIIIIDNFINLTNKILKIIFKIFNSENYLDSIDSELTNYIIVIRIKYHTLISFYKKYFFLFLKNQFVYFIKHFYSLKDNFYLCVVFKKNLFFFLIDLFFFLILSIVIITELFIIFNPVTLLLFYLTIIVLLLFVDWAIILSTFIFKFYEIDIFKSYEHYEFGCFINIFTDIIIILIVLWMFIISSCTPVFFFINIIPLLNLCDFLTSWLLLSFF